MIPAPDRCWRALLAALPNVEGTAELILRPGPERANATLRVDGAPPRVFAPNATGVEELRPEADADLPGAPWLADPDLLGKAVTPRIGPIVDAQLVAWRPGRRAVVRLVAANGSTWWLKLLDRRSHARAERAFAAVGQALAPMRLALPEHMLPEGCAYITAPAAGMSLRCLLAEHATVPLTTMVRGLIALAYTDVHGDLPVHDFTRARAATLAMLENGACLRPDLLGLAEAIARLPAPPPPERPGFVHGDLHDKQLFIAPGCTSVIDLEGMCIGDPRFDLANLGEHIRLRDLQREGRDTGFADLALARCGLDPDQASTRAFRALVRARLCGVYALRPRWQQLVDQLRHETLRLLQEMP